MKYSWVSFLVLLNFLSVNCSNANATAKTQNTKKNDEEVDNNPANKLLSAVVTIKSIAKKNTIDPLGGDALSQFLFGDLRDARGFIPAESNGLGVLITKDGYIATCARLVANAVANTDADAGSIKIVYKENSSFDAEIVAIDQEQDIALLKIVNPPEQCKFDFIEISGEAPCIGEEIYTINIFDSELTLARGIISGIYRSLQGRVSHITDASVNLGAPIMNKKCKILGISNVYSQMKGKYDTTPFAPSAVIYNMLEKARGNYHAGDRDIIVKTASPEEFEILHKIPTKGACLVTRSSCKGIAPGDMIFSINDFVTYDEVLFNFSYNQKIAGEKCKLRVLRKGCDKIVDIDIIRQEMKAAELETAQMEPMTMKPAPKKTKAHTTNQVIRIKNNKYLNGFEVHDIVGEIQELTSPNEEGVMVVGNKGAGKDLDLQQGDIIKSLYDKEVTCVEELINILEENKDNKSISIRYTRGNQIFTYKASPGGVSSSSFYSNFSRGPQQEIPGNERKTPKWEIPGQEVAESA